MKNDHPVRFTLSVILGGVAAMVVLVRVCMPKLVAEVLTSMPGLVGLVFGVTFGILLGYFFHHRKVSPIVEKMNKRIGLLANQRNSKLQELQRLSAENAALKEKCTQLEGDLRRENVARIARQSRNDGVTVPPTPEAPVAESDDEE